MHRFRAAVEARDINAAFDLLSEDVVLRSPVVFSPYQGRDAVAPILHAVFEVFEDFRYVREIGSDDATRTSGADKSKEATASAPTRAARSRAHHHGPPAQRHNRSGRSHERATCGRRRRRPSRDERLMNRTAAVELLELATIHDVEHRWSTVGLYEIADRHISACWLLPLDQRVFDAVWTDQR